MIVCQSPIAVVVLSYNGKDLHKDFFPELLNQRNGLYDVVLVNNASTDDTASYVAHHFPEVKIVDLPVNKGFANGYYEGLLQVQAEYYVLLSADFEISKGWIEPMYEFMRANQDYAAIQPKILYQRDKTSFEYAGAGGGYMDIHGYLFCRGRIFFDLEKDNQQYNDSRQVFWAGGGCMMIRSALYHEVGGLDRDLYAHMEEVDLCWRLQSAGYKIGYVGASTVYHVGGSVISYGSPQKLYYNYRNSLLLLLKNLPANKLLPILIWRLIMDGIAALQELMKGKWINVWTILKAHFHFYTRISSTMKKRKSVLRRFNVYQDSPVIYRKSIVWSYFMRKQKLFSQLNWLSHHE